jgi:hypothetical protein
MNENENETDPVLTVWMLTLPGLEGARMEDNLDRKYLSPEIWPGDWKHFLHANAIVVAAVSEQQARELAATDDCEIWKDPMYARCRVMHPQEAGVIFMVRSGADNE